MSVFIYLFMFIYLSSEDSFGPPYVWIQTTSLAIIFTTPTLTDIS